MSELAPELAPLSPVDAYSNQAVAAGSHTRSLTTDIAALALGLGGVRAAANGVAAEFQQMTAPMAANARTTGQNVDRLTGTVRGLTRAFPESRQEAIATVRAVQSLGLTAKGQEPQVAALAKTVTQLAGATGEAPAQLAAGFGQLTREMASLDPKRVQNMADVLTTMSAKSGAAPSAITDFSKAIGPMAQQAGVGETSVMGIATSFAKLGDDGYVAANTVSKMFDDLNRSVRDGSNEMAGYANIVGMTVDQFKALYESDPAQAIARVTQAVGQMPAGQGTRALEQIGITSPRAQRAFLEQAQSGGMMADIREARQAYGNGSTASASSVGFNTVLNNLQRLGSAAEDVAITFERPLLRSVNSIVSLASTATHGVGAVLRSGPVGTAVNLAGQAALPMLVARLGYRAVSTGALANFVLRSGPMTGALAGLRIGRLGGVAEAQEDAARSKPVRNFITQIAEGGALGTNPFRQRLNERAMLMGTSVGAFFHRDEPEGPSLMRRLFGGGVVAAGMGLRGQAELMRLSRLDPLKRDDYLMRTYGKAGEDAASKISALHDDLKAGKITHLGFAKGAAGEIDTLLQQSGKAGTAFKALGLGIKDLAVQSTLTSGALAKQTLGAGAKAAGAFIRSPLGMVAGVGAAAYLGYSMYRGSQANQRREDALTDNLTGYDVVNAYRDSMGKAGESTLKLSDQINAASQSMLLAVTSFSQAARISQNDYAEINRNRKVTSQFSGTEQQVRSQVQGLDLGNLAPSDVQGAKLDLMRLKSEGKLPENFDVNQALSGLGKGTQSLTGGQIGNIVGGMAAAPGLGDQGSVGSSEWLKRHGVFHFGPGRNSSWSDVGHRGYGTAQLGKTAGGELLNLQNSLMQERHNLGTRYGDKYAAGREIQDMDKAMAAALKTHNADLVVGMEQHFTRQLTGKTMTGVSAQNIQDVGGFTKLLEQHKTKVDGMLTGNLVDSVKTRATMIEDTVATGLQKRVGMIGGFFSNFRGGGIGMNVLEPGRKALTAAANAPDDVQKQHDATMAIVDSGQKAGMSLGQLASQAAKSVESMADGDARRAVMTQVIAEATRQLQNSLGGMTIAGQIGTTSRFATQMASTAGNSQEAQSARQQGQDMATQQINADRSLMQQRLQAQYDYEKQASRASRDFNRGQLWAQNSFNLQMQRMIEDAAKTMYDPYTRIQVEAVYSGANLIGNETEQLQAMRQQVANIKKLRGLGLDEATIQQLGLYSPDKAQQTMELVNDLSADRSEVGQLNRLTTERQHAAKQLLVEDPTFKRNRQDFNIAMRQQRIQFQTQMSDAKQDLVDGDREMTASLTQLQADMNKLLHGQQVDWSTQLKDNLANTVSTIEHWTPRLLRAQKGALAHGSGAGDTTSNQGTGKFGFNTGTPHNDARMPNIHYGRAGASAGVNAGFLLSNISKPGVDMDKMGNKPLNWGFNIAKAPPNDKLSTNAKLAHKMAADYGWTGVEWDALYDVFNQESGFSTTAGKIAHDNPYGIPQAYWGKRQDGTYPPNPPMASMGPGWQTSAQKQIQWGLDYIANRYGDPLGAWAHKSRVTWYADGGIATGPHLGMVGEAGSAEAMIPLNSSGVSYLAKALQTYLSPADAASLRGGGNNYAIHVSHDTYHYDQGQHITGPVTVKANSPAEWAAQSRAETRRRNLTGTRGVRWSRS